MPAFKLLISLLEVKIFVRGILGQETLPSQRADWDLHNHMCFDLSLLVRACETVKHKIIVISDSHSQVRKAVGISRYEVQVTQEIKVQASSS